MARKRRKKAVKKSSSGETCHSCCSCSKTCYILCGLVMLILAFLLWKGMWSLELVVAVLLLIGGLKKLFMGLKG